MQEDGAWIRGNDIGVPSKRRRRGEDSQMPMVPRPKTRKWKLRVSNKIIEAERCSAAWRTFKEGASAGPWGRWVW